jgi:hypothetical protein
MKKKESRDIKIRRIRIIDYKGIDELEIEFTGPKMVGDPDVTIMGSRNGLGKTSVLECCALLFIGWYLNMYEAFPKIRGHSIVDLSEIIIRAGASSARLEGEIVVGMETVALRMEIDKSGGIKADNIPKHLLYTEKLDSHDKMVNHFVSIVSGMNPNPILSENFLYFHSYRKVQEGNPEIGLMIEKNNVHRHARPPGYEVPMSTFKLHILRSMMGHAKLFEEWDDGQSEDVLAKLNELVKRYAGGKIEKLRPSSDNTVDFRIQPVDGGPSFTFDGLSSGQKEIIATLFLIWYQTRNKPGVVLIDEPELHLNPEWHRDFVRQVGKIAPGNQYIIATHSEDVFASVDKDHRLLLQGAAGAKS